MNELSCPEARALVSDYIDGELLPPTARELEDHLQTCPNCPPLYAALVQTLAELRAIDDSEGVEALAVRVVSALTKEGLTGTQSLPNPSLRPDVSPGGQDRDEQIPSEPRTPSERRFEK